MTILNGQLREDSIGQLTNYLGVGEWKLSFKHNTLKLRSLFKKTNGWRKMGIGPDSSGLFNEYDIYYSWNVCFPVLMHKTEY